MLLRALALITLGSLAIAVPGAAAAKRKRPLRPFSTTATVRLIQSTGNPPNAGATGLEQGTIHGGTLGRGRVDLNLIWSALRTFSGSMFMGHPKNNFRGTIHGHGTLRPDGTTSVTGGGRITDGVGTYRGARGSFTFTAVVPANRQGPIDFHFRGKLRR